MQKKEKNFCALTHALSIISGKWKIFVINKLSDEGTLRYKALERAIPDITPKILITVLKELEAEKLIKRNVFPEVPPRVEYSLTSLGESLKPLIGSLAHWGEFHKNEIEKVVEKTKTKKTVNIQV